MSTRITGRLRIEPLQLTQPNRQGSKPNGQDPGTTPARLALAPHQTGAVPLPGLGSHEREPGGRSGVPADPIRWNEDYPELPANEGRGGQDSTDDTPVILLSIRRSRCRGRYTLVMKLSPRDERVAQAIHDHWICAVVTYLDRETRKRWQDKLDELRSEAAGHWQRTTLFAPIPDPLDLAWTGLKTWWHRNHVARGLEVTVGKLLGDGYVCWSDDFDDIRDIERSVLFSLDAIAQSIAVGLGFDTGEENIYSPGTKRKTRLDIDHGGTPPGEW